MVNYFNFSDRDSLGYGFDRVMDRGMGLDDSTSAELIVNTTAGFNQVIFLDEIETIKIYNKYVIFVCFNEENRIFLNLENVLSISLEDLQ